MWKGKKTYTGLAAIVVGALLVVADVKWGITGVADYGLMVMAGGIGLAGYGRWDATKPVVKVKKTRKPRAKKVVAS